MYVKYNIFALMIKTIRVSWMNCASCEAKLEKNIKDLPNVSKVSANRINWTVEVSYENNSPDFDAIELNISELWYKIGHSNRLWFSDNISDYINVCISIIILWIWYLLLRWNGFEFWGVQNLSTSNIWVSLFIGIAAWLSTCMAVIWWLIVWISSKWAEQNKDKTIMGKVSPHMYFHLWRIISFWLLWGLLWLFWSFLHFSSSFLWITTLIIWIIMILLWINLTNISPKIGSLVVSMPKILTSNIWFWWDWKLPTFIMWMSTFFLPCGFTLAMQWFAISTWSFVLWGLAMMLFAIWTLPWLLSVGIISSILKGSWLRNYLAFTWALVLSLWLFNVLNWYDIVSSKYLSKEIVTTSPISNDIQEIRIVQDNTWYTPNKILIEPGKKTKLIIDSKSLYTCASQVIIPSLWVEKTLKLWENIIEFNAPKNGEISFSCAMGMYKGSLVISW